MSDPSQNLTFCSSFPSQPSAGIVHHVILWLVLSFTLWFAWTGFIASDDSYYAIAGAGWANQFPYIAGDFPTARAVIALPIGLMIKLFGESEFTVVLSTCLFFLATASLTLAVLSRLTGPTLATVSCCLMGTVPLLALKATIPSADQPELFFVACAIWLFWLATMRERRLWLLLGAGACTSLAFGAHEVTGGLIIGYGVLFAVGYGIPRREYWVMAIGFFAIVAVECLYYWIFAGNPLHRLSMLVPILAGGVGVVPIGGDRVDPGVLDVALGGTIHLNKVIDPFLMFFTHHDFGLLGFVSVPALWWCCVTKQQDKSLPLVTARLLAIFASVWFLFSSLMLRDLVLGTRYFMVTAYLLMVITAIWACLEMWPRRKRLTLVGGGIFLLVNLVSILLDNKNPRYGERMLVAYLAQSKGPVQVDPETFKRSDFYCKWSGQDCSRIRVGPPQSGAADLYFYYPENAAPGYNKAVKTREEGSAYQPDREWEPVWRHAEPDKPLTTLFAALHLEGRIPEKIYRKLAGPGRFVVVYRLPRQGPAVNR